MIYRDSSNTSSRSVSVLEDIVSVAASEKRVQFRCTNKRDILYGIMSLINWRPFGAPSPYCNGHRLNLALDAFEIIIKERDHNLFRQHSLYEDYALSWAARLLRM